MPPNRIQSPLPTGPQPYKIAVPTNPRPYTIPTPTPAAKQPTPPPVKLTLSRDECALALGLSARTVDSMVKAGSIPFTRIGSRVMFPLAALNAWLAARTTPAQPTSAATNATH